MPPLITPTELSTCLAMVFSFTIFQIMSTLIVSAGAALAHFNGCLPVFFFFLPSILYTHSLPSLPSFWSEFDESLVFTP